MRQLYGSHGHVFSVRCQDLALSDRVATTMVTLAVQSGQSGQSGTRTDQVSEYVVASTGTDTWSLSHEGEEVGTRTSSSGLLLLLQWHVNQSVIARASGQSTTFHAAAAQSPHGTGVLLAAPMESGKTTTCTGLLRAGWGYLTDEAAACHPDGIVHAYPKPLTIDQGAWALFPELAPAATDESAVSWLVPAIELGAPVVPRTRLGLLLFPRYERDAATMAERLRPSTAALELAQSTFRFEQHGARDLACVSSLARSLPAYRVTIGDLEAAVRLITDLAERPAAA